MNRDQKAAVVDEIAGQLESAEAVFAVDYRGISVSQVAELRGKLRDADASFRIVKNSLTERAADKAGVGELKELLEGPTALTLISGDVAVAAKALNDTARTLNLLEFKGGLLNGNALSAEEIRSIARLPAREVLHAQLVGTIAAPISGLVRTLNALIQGLALQLGQIVEQGLVSGEAPAAPEEAPAATEAPAEEAEAATEAPAAEAEAAETPAEVAEEPAPEAEAAAEPEPNQESNQTEPDESPSDDGESDAKEE